MTVTGQDIADAARELLGVYYSWWGEGDPIPKWWYEYGDTAPPLWWMRNNGTMCFPGDTKVSATGIEAASKRFYQGPLIDIKTAAGKELSGTPSHPVLTLRGWVALGKLKKGDRIVRDSSLGEFADLEPHEQREPTPIEQVYDSLAYPGSVERVAGIVEDFRGDGMEGYVDIVYPRRLLRDGADAPLSKHGRQRRLSPSDVSKAVLAHKGALDPVRFVRFATDGLVRCARLGFAFFFGGVLVPQATGLGYGSTGAAFFETFLDNDEGDPEGRGNLPSRFSGDVAPDDFVCVDVEPVARGTITRCLGTIPHLGTGGFQSPADSVGANLELSGESSGALASKILADQVVDIDIRDFVGNVFTLQTASGMYSAFNYITKNCSDLVNYARNACGLPSIGGTPAYYDWAVANGGVDFDPSSPGVPGAICVNPGPWRGDTLLSQGHIAIYTDEHTLIQATDGVGSFAGVNEGEQDYESYGWAGYWTYALQPDVDYSDYLGDDAPEPQPALTVPRWLAYDRDGWPKLDGPDWSKGFHWYDKEGVLLPQWKGPGDA